MGLDRWNEDRADKPANCVREAKPEVVAEATEAPAEEKPKRGRKPKKKEDEE
jgi:hypothetical protein